MNDMRYQNHLSLENFNEKTQTKISASTVSIFGLGGLGSVCSLYLSNAGIGTLNLVDYDSVDETNLPRQIIYKPNQVGMNKAVAAKTTLLEFNPNTKLNDYNQRLIGKDLQMLINKSTIVIDATDNLASRLQINAACHTEKCLHIVGTAIRYDGQVMTFDHTDKSNACLQCLYQNNDENIEDCEGAGVLSTVAGVVGLLMANSAIKAIIGIKHQNEILAIDCKHNDFRNIRLQKSLKCSICS